MCYWIHQLCDFIFTYIGQNLTKLMWVKKCVLKLRSLRNHTKNVIYLGTFFTSRPNLKNMNSFENMFM